MKKFLGVMFLLCALIFTGCGSEKKAPEGAKDGKGGASVSQKTDVVAAMAVDIMTMDPQNTNDTLSGGIQRLVMDGFFSFDDKMKVIPMLATGYKANKDATEFVLTLRKGVKFTDGTPWNAESALANVKKWTDKSMKLKRTSFLSGVIKKAEKVDDYTIKFTLFKPFGAFINNLAHPCCVMMSPKQIAKGNEACARQPVGTGQYTYTEWVAGDHLKLTLNKDWWGLDDKLSGGKSLVPKDAGFKTITFKPVAESATRVAMLQSGDAQISWPVPTENVKALKANKGVKVYDAESIIVGGLSMNNQKKPFTDLRVRQALNYAIDRDAYIKVVQNGMATKGTSIMGPDVQFYKKNNPYPYDPEKAKALLKEAGYPNGFTTTYMFVTTSANIKEAEFFKQQLATVGINLELKGMENAIYRQKLESATGVGADAEVDMSPFGWSSSTGDADWALRPLMATESFPPHSFNKSYYSSKEMDKYIQEGLGSADPKVRQEAYAKAQDLIWKDCPIVVLVTRSVIWGTNNKITGVRLYPDGGINMKNARMM